MTERDFETGPVRCLVMMAFSLCVGIYGAFVLVGIALSGPATGADAVAAALAVWLVTWSFQRFNRRRLLWRQLRMRGGPAGSL